VCERSTSLRAGIDGIKPPPAPLQGEVSLPAKQAGTVGVLSRSALTFAKLSLRAAAKQSLLDFFYVNTIMIIGGSRFA
jgi:hypothetical protein